MTDQKAEYVVFDTEGNGLFEFKDENGVPVPADAPGQPRLASIAFVYCDGSGEPISKDRFLIKPDGWSIHDQDEKSRAAGKITASEVNGLSDDELAANGVPVTDVLNIWLDLIEKGMIVAAYNAQHDCKQIRAELRRAGMPDRFEETRNTCLMRAQKAYKDKGLSGRWISLEKACEFHGVGPFEWHQADADTDAAVALLKILIRDGNLIEPKVHYAAKHPSRDDQQ